MLILFYKPYGVVTQFSPSGEARTLTDFGLPPKVYPAGRLDADSEGLLLLTDDGALQHSLTDPRHGHPRTYLVQVERIPPPAALERLRKGVILKDGKTRPCKVRMLDSEPVLPPRTPPIRCRKTVPTAWLEMTLTEGRNRQIRRMGAAICHPVLRLVRSRIGKRSLEGLTPGQWRIEGLTPNRRPDPRSEG